MTITDFAIKTSAVTDYYLDHDSGSDSNSGVGGWANALGTWAGLRDKFPFEITQNIYVYVRGNSSDFGAIYINTYLRPGVSVVISGEDDWVDVAGPFTATSTTTSTVTVSAAGWTPNDWNGYAIRFTAGPEAGNSKAIKKHTADTITVVPTFAGAPGNNEFYVSRPKTQIAGSTTDSHLVITAAGPGNFSIQNFHISGSKTMLEFGPGTSSQCYLTRVVSDGSKSECIRSTKNKGIFYCSQWGKSTSHGWINGGFGLTVRQGSARITETDGVILNQCVFTVDLEIRSSTIDQIIDCRFYGLIMYKCNRHALNDTGIHDIEVSNPSGIGIQMKACNLFIRSMNVHHCSSVGMEIIDSIVDWVPQAGDVALVDACDNGIFVVESTLYLNSLAQTITVSNNTGNGVATYTRASLLIEGVLAGSGNGNRGAWVAPGSYCQVHRSYVPTITGTNGNVGTPMSTVTWASVCGGTALGDATWGTTLRGWDQFNRP